MPPFCTDGTILNAASQEKIETINLQLGASTEKRFQCLKVKIIRKDLDDTIHQVILRKLIFAVHNLLPSHSKKMSDWTLVSQTDHHTGP
jgi:hypothetical protein